MIYTVRYTEPNGEKEIEAKLDVPDTNMSDFPLVLTEFAKVVCGTDVKVSSVSVDDEEDIEEEGLEKLESFASQIGNF